MDTCLSLELLSWWVWAIPVWYRAQCQAGNPCKARGFGSEEQMEAAHFGGFGFCNFHLHPAGIELQPPSHMLLLRLIQLSRLF